MAQVIALTQIVRTVTPGRAADKDKGIKAVPPVSKTIEKGTLFVSDGEELETLRRARAVRDARPSDAPRPAPVEADNAPRSAPEAKAPREAKQSKAKQSKAADDESGQTGGDDAGLV